MNDNYNIALVGAGAMGAAIGALLRLGGARLSFIDPYREQMEAIGKRGLILQLDGESLTVGGIECFTNAADAERNAPFDCLALMVKGAYTEEAMEQCRCLCSENTVVLTLQNGIGNDELISRFVPPENVLYGLTNVSCSSLAPGKLSAAVLNKRCGAAFGMYKGGELAKATGKRLEAVLNASGYINASFTERAQELVWNKLMINGALNPLGAILRMTVPGMIRDPEAKRLLIQTAREIAAVAKAKGVEGVDALRFENELLPAFEKGPENYPSMAIDVLVTKKRTEIERLNGAVSEWGKRLGTATPLCDMLCAMIQAIENNYDRQY